MRLLFSALISLILSAVSASAGFLNVTQVAPDTYAIVGPLGQRNPGNLGNNATFGLVVTGEGAVLIDAGASRLGAKMLHRAVKGITDQPVVTVINTGGQDHRWLGNGYWHDQGATIIASAAAVEDQKDRVSMQLTALTNQISEFGLMGTEPYQADVTFDDTYSFTLGGVLFELTHAPAHTPGDSFVWLPEASVMFTGDIVYTERLLGVMSFSSSKEWVTSFEALAAKSPQHIVPGHGSPTDLSTAELDTYDYLVSLREQIAAHIDDGGDMIGSVMVDQAAFSYLENFETLAGRNAQETFSQMEWE